MTMPPPSHRPIRCPECKYDLRSQVVSPMPVVVRCPECGVDCPAASLFAPRRTRSNRRTLLWKLLLPMPIGLTFSLVTVIPAILPVFCWPIGVGLFFSHVAWVGVAAGRNNSSPSGWDRLGSGLVYSGLAFIYDVGILASACGFIAISGFHLSC